MSGAPFFVGVNLPWLQYGCDFGANAWQPDGGVGRPKQRERLRRSFARLADRGFTTVRWFVLGDGRAGIRFEAPGLARVLDDVFWRDVDVGVEEAARASLALVPVLLDFPWCRRARLVDGVRCGGHRRALASPLARRCLLDNVIVPVLRRCAGVSLIAAWDVINEPEWITWGVGTLNPFFSVSRSALREFVRDVAAAVHAESRQPVTVGLASTRGLGLVAGLDLDIYQAHWYDRRERRAPLDRSVASLSDRPVWLGEFPTTGSTKTPDEIVATARLAGYAGALAWSAEATDRWSDLDRVRNFTSSS